MVMRVASFLPFQTTYYLNGHSFIEQQTPPTTNRSQILCEIRDAVLVRLQEVRDNSGEGGKITKHGTPGGIPATLLLLDEQTK